MAIVWNPFVGCKKYSSGCLHCYIEKGANKYGYDFNDVHKTKDFDKPIQLDKNGDYKMKSGFSYLCFQSDFFIEEADSFRDECFQMIKKRQDITFLFLTKRITRFYECVPKDYNTGAYDNLIICVTVENQKEADTRLSFLKSLPIKHKMIAIQPMLEKINILPYLDNIEGVEVGGEQDKNARMFDFAWALDIKEQCVSKNVSFRFRQVGSLYKKGDVITRVNPFYMMKKAKEENIDFIVK